MLLILVTASGQQPAADDDAEPDIESMALVHIDLNSYGAAKIKVSAYTGTQKIDLAAILKRHFPCANARKQGASAECQVLSLVPTDGQAHTLRIGPFVSDLRAAGIVEISAQLNYSGWQITHDRSWESREHSLSFNPEQASAMPSALTLTSTPRPSLILPLGMVLLVPLALALLLRRSSEDRVAWMFCLINVTWFYWIYAWEPRQFSEFILMQPWATVWTAYPIAVAFYSLPPLLAITGVITLLSPTRESLRTVLLQNAHQMLPLGFFFAAGGFEGRWILGGVGLGYLAHHFLNSLLLRHHRAVIREVVSGEWFERIVALSLKAGVKLQRLLLHRSAASAAINAYAIPGDLVMLSEAMVEQMPPREVDSIVGHELAHLKKNDGVVQTLFWFGFVVLNLTIGHSFLPPSLQSLPVFMILGTIVFAQLSQFHEFRADAFSAQLREDPEGMIAALGRLARMNGSGLRSNPVAGFILTHPSMERRALSLARKFSIEPARAIAILKDPDLIHDTRDDVQQLQAAVAAEVPKPPSSDQAIESIFSRPETEQYSRQIGWIREGVVLATLIAVAAAQFLFMAIRWELKLLYAFLYLFTTLGGIIVASNLATFATEFWERRQSTAWGNELRQRFQPRADATFVALRPGSQIRFLGGNLDWDLGFITLTGSSLKFHGERIQFELPASSIYQVEKHTTRFLWDRIDAVHIQSAVGSFSLRDPLRAHSTRTVLQPIEEWWQRSDAAQVDPPRPSLFPVLDPPPIILGMIFLIGWRFLKLWGIVGLLFSFGFYPYGAGLILLLAPVAWLLTAIPDFWRVMRGKSIRTRFHPRHPARVPIPIEPAQIGTHNTAEVLN